MLAFPAHASLADDVMARLAAQSPHEAHFVEEKRLSSLTVPLLSHGRLLVSPGHLEKITEAPRPERLAIDGDQLTITAGGEPPRRIALDEHPELRALADTFRATLAGDLATLRRLYAIEEQGTLPAWRLLLVPREPALRRLLARVTLDGNDATLRQIDIQQPGGDEQRMTIQ